MSIRFSPLSDRDDFAPATWPQHPFTGSAAFAGCGSFIDALSLADGVYEYEFVANGNIVVPDPYAEPLTRFGGYRGVFDDREGRRCRAAVRLDRRVSRPELHLPKIIKS